MQTLVLCLMVAVSLSTVLKLSLATPRIRIATIALCALFVAVAWPWAVEQSKTQIESWLANTDLMRDTAVVLSFDVAVMLAFCWNSAIPQAQSTTDADASSESSLRQWQKRVTRCILTLYPGLLIVPVLFSLEVTTIFALPGWDFSLVAYLLAAVVGIGLVAFTYGWQLLLPERELRYELLFLLNVLIAILGIIATVNGRTAVAAVGAVDWLALAGVVGFFLVFALIGFGVTRRKLLR